MSLKLVPPCKGRSRHWANPWDSQGSVYRREYRRFINLPIGLEQVAQLSREAAARGGRRLA